MPDCQPIMLPIGMHSSTVCAGESEWSRPAGLGAAVSATKIEPFCARQWCSHRETYPGI